MAGFKAAEAVEKLDYDFTDLGKPELDGVKGTTPEPSSAQVRHMRWRIQQITQAASADQDDLSQRLSEMSEDEFAERDEELIAAIAEVTSGQPTREEIDLLPHRVQQAYIGWLLGQLTDPEPKAAGTKPSLKAVPGG